jgi:hypothetical protein
MKETIMKRTSAIVLALALAGSAGCGSKTQTPEEPDPGVRTCQNAELETCTTQPDPTSQPDAGTPTP